MTTTSTPTNIDPKKIPDVSAMLVSLIYLVLFVIIGLIYDKLISDQILLVFNHHPLLDFAGPNLDINGYDNYKKNIDQLQSKFRFWSIFFVFGIIIANNMGIYTAYMKGTQPGKALPIILGFAMIIVAPMYLLCNKITFIKVFENSIGYMVTKLLYRKHGSFTAFINTLFTHKSFTTSPEIKVDFGFLFSLFRLDNFGTMLYKMRKTPTNPEYNFHVDTAIREDDLRYLLRAVVTKNTIGHLSWIYFATLAATLISVQYLSFVL